MKRDINKLERYIYYFSGALGTCGLVFIILGIIAENGSYESILNQIQLYFRFRYFGLILFGAAVLISLVTLLIYARIVDRENEKNIRRKQRLNALMSDAKKDENTLVVENGVVKEEEKDVTIDTSKKDEVLDNTINNK